MSSISSSKFGQDISNTGTRCDLLAKGTIRNLKSDDSENAVKLMTNVIYHYEWEESFLGVLDWAVAELNAFQTLPNVLVSHSTRSVKHVPNDKIKHKKELIRILADISKEEMKYLVTSIEVCNLGAAFCYLQLLDCLILSRLERWSSTGVGPELSPNTSTPFRHTAEELQFLFQTRLDGVGNSSYRDKEVMKPGLVARIGGMESAARIEALATNMVDVFNSLVAIKQESVRQSESLTVEEDGDVRAPQISVSTCNAAVSGTAQSSSNVPVNQAALIGQLQQLFVYFVLADPDSAARLEESGVLAWKKVPSLDMRKCIRDVCVDLMIALAQLWRQHARDRFRLVDVSVGRVIAVEEIIRKNYY